MHFHSISSPVQHYISTIIMHSDQYQTIHIHLLIRHFHVHLSSTKLTTFFLLYFCSCTYYIAFSFIYLPTISSISHHLHAYHYYITLIKDFLHYICIYIYPLTWTQELYLMLNCSDPLKKLIFNTHQSKNRSSVMLNKYMFIYVC